MLRPTREEHTTADFELLVDNLGSAPEFQGMGCCCSWPSVYFAGGLMELGGFVLQFFYSLSCVILHF